MIEYPQPENWTKIKEKVDSIPWDTIEAKQDLYKLARLIIVIGCGLLLLTITNMAFRYGQQLVKTHQVWFFHPILVGIGFIVVGIFLIKKFDLWQIKMKNVL
jgi:H+/Cl- antiporter ClcA